MFKTKLSEGGRIVIPVEYRKAMGLHIGDELLIQLEEGELRVHTLVYAIQSAQKVVHSYVSSDRSLVDELIDERREASQRE